MIIIKEVKTKRQGRLFTNFPNKMYKNVEAFVPALSDDEHRHFSKKINPAHKYIDSIRFLAYKDNVLVGRIAGLVNHKYNEAMKVNQVRFTRLDMIDDIEVTKTLINAVESWGVETFNTNEIIGPIGFTDLDRQGMLIQGFDQLNMSITIYNFPYYKNHMEILGFEKEVDWSEKKITWPTEIPEKVTRVSEAIKKRHGYRLYKPKTTKDIDGFIYEAFDVYNEAFNELYGFYPVTREVIDFYFGQVKALVRKEWIWIIYDKEDKIAGFGLVMPSLSLAYKKTNGKIFPFGWIKILGSFRKYEVIDFYFIAVKPEHQNKGVSALMFEDGIKTGIKNNVRFAETGPELVDNIAIQSFWKGFEHVEHKVRRCWKKKI